MIEVLAQISSRQKYIACSKIFLDLRFWFNFIVSLPILQFFASLFILLLTKIKQLIAASSRIYMFQAWEQLPLCIQSSVLICLSPFLTRPSKVVDFLKPQIPILRGGNISLADCWNVQSIINFLLYNLLVVDLVLCTKWLWEEMFASCLVYIQRTFSSISCYFACDVFCFLWFNSQNSDIWNEECMVWVCKSTPNLWTSFPSVLETFQKYDRLCRAARVISPEMSLWSWTCFLQRLVFMNFISFEEIAKCETWNENFHKHCARFQIVFRRLRLQHGQKTDHNSNFKSKRCDFATRQYSIICNITLKFFYFRHTCNLYTNLVYIKGKVSF